jgi:hypothetical protein
MVRRRGKGRSGWGVTLALTGLAVLHGGLTHAAAPATAPGPPAAVREALKKGAYPWYDTRNDTVKPLWPPREQELRWDWLDRLLKGKNLSWIPALGQLIMFVLAMVGLVILLAVLLALWRHYQPSGDDWLTQGWRARDEAGAAARIEDLPEGLRPETDDPWAEALRCRDRGDYARAVVCLFVHQLLTLERLRQLRLHPGRTGRQLVRSIGDREFRTWVDTTLRLFEGVYYGHHPATAEAFEPVWVAAEAFEQRIAIAKGVAR